MKNLYLKIPEKIRIEIKSAFYTFITVFILTFCYQWAKGDITLTFEAIAGLAGLAVRAGIKAVATLLVGFLTPSK